MRDKAAVCIMYYGGLRATEVVTLRMSDLDLDNKKLRVNQGKGNDYSPVNVTEEAVDNIRKYIREGRPKPAKPEYAELLFLSIRGRPMTRGNLWATVKRIAFWAGIEKNIYPHIFRHTMATKMAEQGLNAFEIQAQTRHKHIETVQKYVHISEKARRTAYDRAFEPEQQPKGPGLMPLPAPGPELYAQGGPQVVMMTPQQLQQVIQAAIGASPKLLPGYQ